MSKFYVRRTAAEFKAFCKKHQAEWTETGTKINDLRIGLRLSKKALAKMAGICVNTLTKLERGQYITRFKPVSHSCLNALESISYRDLYMVKK